MAVHRLGTEVVGMATRGGVVFAELVPWAGPGELTGLGYLPRHRGAPMQECTAAQMCVRCAGKAAYRGRHRRSGVGMLRRDDAEG